MLSKLLLHTSRVKLLCDLILRSQCFKELKEFCWIVSFILIATLHISSRLRHVRFGSVYYLSSSTAETLCVLCITSVQPRWNYSSFAWNSNTSTDSYKLERV
jgi:hypothetical protein